jgi:hypothetical protein
VLQQQHLRQQHPLGLRRLLRLLQHHLQQQQQQQHLLQVLAVVAGALEV